jgi:hypothetical protein
LKKNLVNVVLLVASVIFSLLALEVGLRVYHNEWKYTNFRVPQENKFGNHTFDAELGWVPKQGKSSFEGATTVTVFKDGIRSNGSGDAWEGSDHPILAVGDSFTFGDGVSDWETWPAQLERLSGRRVINGGVGGYGVDQIFLRTQRLLSRYQFSTVIFSFIPADIYRDQMSVLWAKAKPYFDFRDGQLTLENVPVPPPSLKVKDGKLEIALEHSRLVHAVMKRLFPKWWLKAPSEIQVQDEKSANKVACALLHNLEDLTKSLATDLMVLLEHGEGFAESVEDAKVLNCLSVPTTRVLDLGPELSRFKANDRSRYDRLYFSSHGHMTAEGNQFVALEISKVLEPTGGQALSAGSK